MLKRLLIFLSIMLLIAALTVAQDDDVEGDIELFGNTNEAISYLITQEATFGDLQVVDDVDGRYTLILGDIGDQTDVIQVSPPGILSYSTANLATMWQAARAVQAENDLTTQVEAELNVGGDVILLIITGASYDTAEDIMQYDVQVVDYIPSLAGVAFDLSAITAEDEASKRNVPTELDDPTLTISLSENFWRSLNTGVSIRNADFRMSENAACQEARDSLQELSNQRDIARVRSWITSNCNQ